MSPATFLNRQALYLRPDPARVIVRPFKPATEPRDLNATDKTRANHIVDRVLALDTASASLQLADVLESFAHRHRNLLAMFEARADEMEAAVRVVCEEEMLANYIAWLAQDPEAAQEVGRRAAAHIAKNHAVELVAEKYWELILSHAKARSSQRTSL